MATAPAAEVRATAWAASGLPGVCSISFWPTLANAWMAGSSSRPSAVSAYSAVRTAYLHKRYALLDATLSKQPWLLGEHFSVADAYLFTVTNWSRNVHLDLSGFHAIADFQHRVAARPAVQAALRAEGLVK